MAQRAFIIETDDSLPWTVIRDAVAQAGFGTDATGAEAWDLLVIPSSQFGTGDTIALSIPPAAGANLPAVLVLARSQTTPRWREQLLERVREAAIKRAPGVRVNALVLPTGCESVRAEMLTPVIAYLARAAAVVGQVIALEQP